MDEEFRICYNFHLFVCGSELEGKEKLKQNYEAMLELGNLKKYPPIEQENKRIVYTNGMNKFVLRRLDKKRKILNEEGYHLNSKGNLEEKFLFL